MPLGPDRSADDWLSPIVSSAPLTDSNLSRRSVNAGVIQRDGSGCNLKSRREPACHLSINHAEHPVATNPPTTAAFLELEAAVELLLPPGTATCRSMRWASLAR